MPESGRDKEPRFRRRSSPYVSGFNLFYSRRPESGLGFVPGIWAPKCARIPAQKNQKNQCCVCGHFGTLVPPVLSGPCPSTAQTSVCQCYGGCNVQPVPKTAGAAGLLEISGLRCAKHSSVRETMFATPRYGTWRPESGPIFRAQNQDRFLFEFLLFFVIVRSETGSGSRGSDRPAGR